MTRVQSLRLFNRHSTSCTLGGRPIFLSPLFFRTYLSEPSPALTIATHDCFPSTHKVLPSPLVSSSQMRTRINVREEKSTSRIKKKGVRRVKGWRERYVSYVSRMRAHDSCFHEWKVLLVFWRSGALVQWSTGNAWLHPVSVCGPVTTCSEITEWTRPEEEQQEIYHRRNRGKSCLINNGGGNFPDNLHSLHESWILNRLIFRIKKYCIYSQYKKIFIEKTIVLHSKLIPSPQENGNSLSNN